MYKKIFVTYRREAVMAIRTPRTYSISEIREEITRLPEQFEQEPEAVTITRRGRPVMAILPFEAYQELLEKIEALQETLEVIQDEELMTAFREGVKALQNGETVAWEDAKRELGLS
jgi:antitoxin YefM